MVKQVLQLRLLAKILIVLLNLKDELDANYGTHRSGWSYAVNTLAPLHDPGGPRLISFIEKKFIFGGEPGDALNGFMEVNYPWVGFLHVPANVPVWFNGHYSPRMLFSLPRFQRALPYCMGMFSLSSPLTRWIEQNFQGPAATVLHPTGQVDIKFKPGILKSSKRINVIQLGFWLRRMHAIHLLDLPKARFRKLIVGINKPYQKQIMRIERKLLDMAPCDNDVEFIDFLENAAYDELLSRSLVFVDFYDTSANNAIIECIARGVPVICPPIMAVADYLGRDYPLYFHDYAHAAELAQSPEAILAAHEYLMSEDIQSRVRSATFIGAVQDSKVLRMPSGD